MCSFLNYHEQQIIIKLTDVIKIFILMEFDQKFNLSATRQQQFKNYLCVDLFFSLGKQTQELAHTRKSTHYGKYFSMELLSIHNKDVCKMSRQTIKLKGDHVQRTILLAFRPKQIVCLRSESVTTSKLQKDISSTLPGTLRTMRRS